MSLSVPLSFSINEPLIYIDNYGQYLTVPQCGLYNYQLKPTTSQKYRRYVKCNPFIMYRLTLQEALRCETREGSFLAQQSWNLASEDFKDFFKKYACEVFVHKPKIFRIKFNKQAQRRQRTQP